VVSRPPSSATNVDAGDPLAQKHPASIAGMFDAIAQRYDLLNHLLSAGFDRRWRRRAIASLGIAASGTVVDVCTGTADLALEAQRAGAARVIGIDFAHEMLRIGLEKVRRTGPNARISLARGDAMRLPLPDGVANGATVAFGIRNVADPRAACLELRRVLVPGGRLAILEFSIPRTPCIRAAYLWYFRTVLPRIGRLVSRHGKAYAYLPASVGSFAGPAAFVEVLRDCGFTQVSQVPLTFGIVYLYVAERPRLAGGGSRSLPS
jgi:demethylmenaquinone methyltransferase/2-methoxy-6-polyprenyl-1,4-benzoquinol methylase